MMLSERLKEETHSAHISVEKLVIPRIKNLNSNQSYLKLLKLFYGYFKPVEERIDAFISDDVVPDISERRKSKVLLRDLQLFNGNESETVVCKDVPEISDVAEALGAMYVLEGSTLGGVHLSKMISEKMNIQSEKGLEFFSGYGSETLVKWNLFKEHLNKCTDEEIQDKIVGSANETFDKFKRWIEAN